MLGGKHYPTINPAMIFNRSEVSTRFYMDKFKVILRKIKGCRTSKEYITFESDSMIERYRSLLVIFSSDKINFRNLGHPMTIIYVPNYLQNNPVVFDKRIFLNIFPIYTKKKIVPFPGSHVFQLIKLIEQSW